MPAIDTSVLPRLIVRDDVVQAQGAATFVARGPWTLHRVLVETRRVRKSVYDTDASQIAATVEMLSEHDQVVLQDADKARAPIDGRRWPLTPR